MSLNFIQEEILITGYGSDGSGIGKLHDGRVTFVQGVIPKEKVLVRYPQTDKQFIKSRLVKIISPSPVRIEPECTYFDKCALCQFQFLAADQQLAAKKSILIDQFKRIGGVPNPESFLKPYISSPAVFGYRRKMHFQIMPDGKFGLPSVNRKEPITVERCPVCSEAINDTLKQIALESDEDFQYIDFREGAAGDIQLILRGDMPKPEAEIETDLPISMVYSSPEGSFVMAGDSTIMQQPAALEICASEDSFFYPNPDIYGAICSELESFLPEFENDCVLNLNAGTGFWSKWFAGKSNKVIAQESDERLAEDFALNLDEFDNVDLYLGAATDVLPALKEKISAVVTETAASGISPAMIRMLAEKKVRHVLYIGHDSAILARDTARLLEQGFLLKVIIPFDNEPQTARISAVAIFELT